MCVLRLTHYSTNLYLMFSGEFLKEYPLNLIIPCLELFLVAGQYNYMNH